MPNMINALNIADIKLARNRAAMSTTGYVYASATDEVAIQFDSIQPC